ncbi:MAG: H-NS histone family protein [Rhodobacteraceae bacterium]|nr:H-NS histone family protein [Paracoccaceae bacterium]
MAIDLLSMSTVELKQLRIEVDAALKTVKKRERKDAMRAAEEAAAQFGFTLAEITGTPPKRKSPVAGIAKYRNPGNADQTWTGKGRRPDWFKQAVEAGIGREQMKI